MAAQKWDYHSKVHQPKCEMGGNLINKTTPSRIVTGLTTRQAQHANLVRIVLEIGGKIIHQVKVCWFKINMIKAVGGTEFLRF